MALVEFWFTEQPFVSFEKEVREFTLLTTKKLFLLKELGEFVFNLAGDYAEVGVYRGGSLKFIAKSFPEKNILGFDTFASMPKTDSSIDIYKEGQFGDTNLNDVQKLLRNCPNVTLYPGFFPATATILEEPQFSFVHVDVDIYPSVLSCCEWFYPRLVTGGVIINDDYGHTQCPGAKKAFDEFFQGREKIIRTTIGTAFIIKHCA